MLVGHYHTKGNCNGIKRVDEYVRYTIRIDGFASYNAGFSKKTVVTNPFVFEGDELFINMSTSAKGGIYVTIKDEDGNSITSCEIFGDSHMRRVHFDGASLSDFAGKTVTMEFEMKDAKLYAFEFK